MSVETVVVPRGPTPAAEFLEVGPVAPRATPPAAHVVFQAGGLPEISPDPIELEEITGTFDDWPEAMDGLLNDIESADRQLAPLRARILPAGDSRWAVSQAEKVRSIRAACRSLLCRSRGLAENSTDEALPPVESPEFPRHYLHAWDGLDGIRRHIAVKLDGIGDRPGLRQQLSEAQKKYAELTAISQDAQRRSQFNGPPDGVPIGLRLRRAELKAIGAVVDYGYRGRRQISDDEMRGSTRAWDALVNQQAVLPEPVRSPLFNLLDAHSQVSREIRALTAEIRSLEDDDTATAGATRSTRGRTEGGRWSRSTQSRLVRRTDETAGNRARGLEGCIPECRNRAHRNRPGSGSHDPGTRARPAPRRVADGHSAQGSTRNRSTNGSWTPDPSTSSKPSGSSASSWTAHSMATRRTSSGSTRWCKIPLFSFPTLSARQWVSCGLAFQPDQRKARS